MPFVRENWKLNHKFIPMKSPNVKLRYNGIFWIHLAVTLGAWLGPFLIDWRLISAAYILVVLQFLIFGKCLMNQHHDLDESKGDDTFYSTLLESIGIHIPKSPLKKFVRRYLYLLLAVFSYLWQVIWQNPPIWF